MAPKGARLPTPASGYAAGMPRREEGDGIQDGANMRRRRESTNERFGLTSTLVTGDFLFIKAFEFAGRFDDTVVQWTADACTLLTEGEILQGYFNRNTKVTVKDYLEIVRRKTASLFQTGTKLGAYMAGATPPQVEWIGQYGDRKSTRLNSSH